MEKQFVTYEIALALKELGFDKIFRFGSDASLYNSKGEHVFYSNYGFMSSGLSDGYISAPLWQQVIDWLDDKFNFLIIIVYDKKFGYQWKIITNKNKTIFDCVVTYQRLYDAREQAILKAIELIQNGSY